MHRIAIFALSAVMTAAAADVAGKWNVVAQAGDRQIKVDLELKNEGGKLSGSMSSPQGTVEITEVKLSGNELTYKISTGEAAYSIKMTLDGDSMKGNWTAPDGNTGAISAARAGSAAAAAGSNKAVLGKWKATAIGSSGQEIRVAIDVTETDGKLGGTLTTADGQTIDLSDTKFESNDLSFALNTPDGVYKIKMTLSGDTLKGSYTEPGGNTGKVSATR